MSTDFGAGEGGRGSQGDLNIYCRFPGSLDVPPERRSLFLSLSSQVFFLVLRCLSLTPVPRWYFLVIASSASFFASWTPSFAVAFIASYTWNPAVPFILSLFLFLFFRQSLKLLEKKKKKKPHLVYFCPANKWAAASLANTSVALIQNGVMVKLMLPDSRNFLCWKNSRRSCFTSTFCEIISHK